MLCNALSAVKRRTPEKSQEPPNKKKHARGAKHPDIKPGRAGSPAFAVKPRQNEPTKGQARPDQRNRMTQHGQAIDCAEDGEKWQRRSGFLFDNGESQRKADRGQTPRVIVKGITVQHIDERREGSDDDRGQDARSAPVQSRTQ
ncbi:MAG: hypothetical protein M5R36_18060 [Deltaproteobacteria bacterium]|nr:hypothetical protein [Deltaproteobacteria bacterium]